jgi:hypothetical protein
VSAAALSLVRDDALPRVDLFPADVRERRRTLGLRRGLALGLLGLLVVCAGGWAVALVQQEQAETELASVEARTADLLTEQQRYAEVPRMLSQIEAIETARRQVTGTEVLWQPYMGAIAATAPAGVSIESLAVSVAAGFEGEVTNEPASPRSPGTVVFTARSADLPDTADWVEDLAAVPGFANPWFSTASITESEGVVHYVVSGQVEITATAFADRFEEEN